ncbi:MAG TPA: MoxR family ATPase [Micromonosporaceae bacterium]|nr:MoxR family ATPase [Micromonosporaceae bacterium]
MSVGVDGQALAGQVHWFAQRFDGLARNVETFIRGKSDVVRMALVCMLAEGHLLIDDVPGVGKTSLAKAISQSIDGSMRRIQFTPDLLPSDVTGVQVYDAGRREFVFHPGAVFANIVLGDEINRASPKTQSALLEVMAERQVTVDSIPYLVPRPFIVIATQNPVEHGGTYDLPEAQLDRFMMRTAIGYPDHEAECEVVTGGTRGHTPEQLQAVMSTSDLLQMTQIAEKVYLAPAIISYIVTITAATRTAPELRLGASPRASLAVAQAAQAYAAAQGRPFVTADDVKAMVPYVLAHRTILRPEAELQGRTSTELLQGILTSVPVPQQRTGV